MMHGLDTPWAVEFELELFQAASKEVDICSYRWSRPPSRIEASSVLP